jgi:alpha-tubulin suppressor-like RCC1 family protein
MASGALPLMNSLLKSPAKTTSLWLLALAMGCGRSGLEVQASVSEMSSRGDGIDGGPQEGPTEDRSKPVAIAAGGFHTCALFSDGTVECWGLNDSGQLGDSTMTTSPVPVAVAGLKDAVAIAAGYDNTCALRAGGTVECWGTNQFGELGDGTARDRSVPGPVTGVTDAKTIAGAFNHACALIGDGTMRCWGDGRSGELGDGMLAGSPTPVAVTGLSGATSLTQGSTAEQTCALLEGGRAACWGVNVFGDLGSGSAAEDSATPMVVSNLSGATQLASGNEHVCALLAGGTASCWGNDEWGQLGDGVSGEENDVSTPVPVTGLTGATQLSAGLLHTCALLGSGGVVCWGLDVSGQLGHGTSGHANDTSSPVDVKGITGATAISAGAYYACALLDGGSVECWGDNQYGQLGDGTMNDSSIPVRVSF